ncbi:hypothetical protein Lal_00016964 [Lupinus albus]|nr:hypothetical protein Lal_00016964 [Lupinus albus]
MTNIVLCGGMRKDPKMLHHLDKEDVDGIARRNLQSAAQLHGGCIIRGIIFIALLAKKQYVDEIYQGFSKSCKEGTYNEHLQDY